MPFKLYYARMIKKLNLILREELTMKLLVKKKEISPKIETTSKLKLIVSGSEDKGD